VGSNKKNSTAVKTKQDFETDVLAEELKGVLQSVPDNSADDFFSSLTDEMVDSGSEQASNFSDDDDFSRIDIVPEHVKNSTVEHKSDPLSKNLGADGQVDEDDVTQLENMVKDLESSISFHGAEAENGLLENLQSENSEENLKSETHDLHTMVSENPIDQSRSFEEDKTQAFAPVDSPTPPPFPPEVKAEQRVFQRNPAIDLKNADYIKFAQSKIKGLEKNLSVLTAETQQLALAGSHFKALADEREQRNKSLEAKLKEVQSFSAEEKKILNTALQAKETKISLLQERVESLEVELESKYNRLRVRERELESRLEILKQEQDAVTSSKDDLILKVKKQNSILAADLEKARTQNKKINSNLQEKEDALRRTIKALKISLTMLESQKKD